MNEYIVSIRDGGADGVRYDYEVSAESLSDAFRIAQRNLDIDDPYWRHGDTGIAIRFNIPNRTEE